MIGYGALCEYVGGLLSNTLINHCVGFGASEDQRTEGLFASESQTLYLDNFLDMYPGLRRVMKVSMVNAISLSR
jgi:hypothetical protein